MNVLKKTVQNLSLQKYDPELAAQWIYELNDAKSPAEFKHTSNFKAWWQCPIAASHKFRGSIQRRTKSFVPGKACPFCMEKRSEVNPRRPSSPLSQTHPELAVQWNCELNSLSPDQVSHGSNYLAHWICPQREDHLFCKAVINRVRSRTKHWGCPYCELAGRRRQNPGPDFYEPLPQWLVDQWDYELNEDSPEDHNRGSRAKVFWRCSNGPDHRWSVAVYSRARGTGCPFCKGQRVSVTNSLATKFPELVMEWSEKNDFAPDEITSKSDKYAWWRCSSNSRHHWKAKILNRTINGSGCPSCPKSK